MKKKNDEKKPKMVANKENDAEDWCFICKDGGELIICDYGDCLKVYHPHCVRKDKNCSEIEEGWTCDRHSCMMCRKAPKYHCFCCPNSVCEKCIRSSELVRIRADGGLCDECSELVLLGEEDEAYDSDGVMIDFKDRNTHEGLFKEYWEIIKEQEGLTMADVYAAIDKIKKKKCRKRASDSGKFGKYQTDDDFVMLEYEEGETEPHKPFGKRKLSKKTEFDGWGSKPLIEFLRSIGKDTTEPLSHYEVDSIIKAYIQEKKLADPARKCRVFCDEKLSSFFGKKTLMKRKIFYMLESHFVENLEALGKDIDDDDDDNDDVDNEELGIKKDEDAIVAKKKPRSLSSGEQSQKKKVDSIFRPSCFASIVSDNIKLVYLRRSLVEELFKQPEKFEQKVVGSFVRVKTDAVDCLQRNSHQLLPVIGVEKSSTGEIFLEVSSIPKHVRVRMLSDSDFTQEECQALQEMIENGVLKKLTIVELEEKAISLHEDVTKHWIKRELILLQHRIDHANEKGRRRETLFNYIEQKELLEKPTEQEKLLKKMPKVIPEVVEVKAGSEVVEID